MKKVLICLFLILALATSSFAIPNKITFKFKPYKMFNNQKMYGAISEDSEINYNDTTYYDDKTVKEMIRNNRIMFGVMMGTGILFTVAVGTIVCAVMYNLLSKPIIVKEVY